MLTGLSSLICRYVFCRLEHNAKGKLHGIEFWNVDRLESVIFDI